MKFKLTHNIMKLLLLFVMTFLPMETWADPVEINGIWYNLVSKAKQAEVTSNPDNQSKYAGEVIIPDKINYEGIEYDVSTIGEKAFSYCGGLTSVTIASIVTSIGNSAFDNCRGLSSVKIPNSVITIGDNAFCGCTGLTSLIIGNSVTSIGNYAFAVCSGLTSVSVPNSVTSIGTYTFQGCIGLTTVSLSDNLTFIAYGAFYGCTSLSSIIIPNNVTRIGAIAFMDCTSLNNVVIGNNVLSIGEESFRNCSSLYSVTIGENVSYIDSYAFFDCTNLNSVYISDLKSWCSISYKDGRSSPLIYAHHLYLNNEEIIDLVIPNTVKSIGEYAFTGCEGITSVTIPNSVTSINNAAFYGCSGLPSVTIPNSVTFIGNAAFSNCSSLVTITLGSGIKEIRSSVFASCPELTDVYCYAKDVPKASDDIFLNSYVDYATLHVREKLIETYKSTSPWNTFKEIVKIDIPKYTITYSIDGEVYKSYEIEEGESITPEPAPTREGYTFSGWSEIPATMPAHDVTVTGSFTINQYTITYIIDNEVYTTQTVDYGSTIIPPTTPEREGYDFAWGDYPETMPAYDITIYGTYTTGIEAIMVNEVNCQIFSLDGKTLNKPQKGVNIVRMSNGQVRKVVVK